MNIVDIHSLMNEKYESVFDTITMPRTPLEIEWFVVGRHDHPMQQYKQAVIEMESRYQAILEAEENLKRKDIHRRRILLQLKTEQDQFTIEELQLDLAKIDREERIIKIGMIGAGKELLVFDAIIKKRFPDFLCATEERLLEMEGDYWKSRFAKQIAVDLMTFGRIGEGNRSALMGMSEEVQKETLQLAVIKTESRRTLEEGIAQQAILVFQQQQIGDSK